MSVLEEKEKQMYSLPGGMGGTRVNVECASNNDVHNNAHDRALVQKALEPDFVGKHHESALYALKYSMCEYSMRSALLWVFR